MEDVLQLRRRTSPTTATTKKKNKNLREKVLSILLEEQTIFYTLESKDPPSTYIFQMYFLDLSISSNKCI